MSLNTVYCAPSPSSSGEPPEVASFDKSDPFLSFPGGAANADVNAAVRAHASRAGRIVIATKVCRGKNPNRWMALLIERVLPSADQGGRKSLDNVIDHGSMGETGRSECEVVSMCELKRQGHCSQELRSGCCEDAQQKHMGDERLD